MKKTFVCDDTMVITVPIRTFRNTQRGQLMPETFHCVFKDSYKVFLVKGKPRPLGAAQVITGMLLVALGLLFQKDVGLYTLPSMVFVVCGMMSYAAGHCPNMHVTKLSFSLNIISFFWSVVAFVLCLIWLLHSLQDGSKLLQGVNGLIMSLLVVEDVIAVFLIYWLSKAVCRDHFNTLPIILLKHTD